MALWRNLFIRVRAVFDRNALNRELDDEVRFHLEHEAQANIARGMKPEEAARQARMDFGGEQGVKEEFRAVRGDSLVESLLQDARFGLRMLRKSPAFSILSIVTLALGIGTNTAMFSVIYRVLLQPPPFQEPSRVAVVLQNQPNGNSNVFSTPDFLEWKRQSGPLTKMAAFLGEGHALGTRDSVERLQGWRVSADAFSVMGMSPTLGRPFSADEDRPGGGNVVLLSDALWKTRFQSDPGILGTKVDFDGVPYTVIGVMPPGFYVFGDQEMFWMPLQLQTQDAMASSRTVHWLLAMVRLDSDSNLKKSQSILDGIATRLHHDDPTGDAGYGVALQSYQDFVTAGLWQPLLLLMGCVGFILLIACANVANLLLARGSTRRLEMSIRVAIGARRGRVVRQLLTESVLLAVLGGIAGLFVAFGALKLVLALNPASLPSPEKISINLPVLLFTLAVCLVVGVLFGVAPAFATSRVDVSNALRDAGRRTGRSTGKHRAVLVVAETALASVLLIGAGLSLKSLWKVAKVDPGFNPTGLITFRLSTPPEMKAQPALFYQQVLEKLRALPGVESAVLARDVPMSGTDPSMPVAVDGNAPQVTDGQVVSRLRVIGPGYFHSFQTPLLQGHEFSDSDTANSQPVVIVSQSLAERYWAGKNPIGRTLKPNIPDAPWYTVVGVAADVRHWAQDVDIEPTAYYPYTQVPPKVAPLLLARYMTVIVRGSTHMAGMMDSIRQAVASVNKTVPVYQIKTVEEMLADSGSLRRFDMWLLSAFAALALTLAAVGVYGVMAYLVSQRTREIGIRMALGARRADVLRLIMSHGLKLSLTGVLLGTAGAAALTRVMVSLLYQVSPTDVSTFVLVSCAVLVFILLACYVPSLRATRVDPNVALRQE